MTETQKTAIEYIPFEIYSELSSSPEGYDIGIVSNGSAGLTWGRAAAGLLVVSSDLQEVLLLRRSYSVRDPLLWGIPGGARKEIEGGLEESLTTAVVESSEEMGGLPKGKIRKQPYVHKKPGTDFTYETFILEIEPGEIDSFIPELNWENTDYRWFKLDELDKLNLHPGVREVLKNYVF